MKKTAAPIKAAPAKTALIAVLRAPRDLGIAAREHWYRIPLKKMPRNYFTHIAFYQPACFKPEGKRISYYAGVSGRAIKRRIDIFPSEPAHPAAGRLYLKYTLGPLVRLPRPLLNNSGTRINFGFAPLRRLERAGDILGLFNVFPVENAMCAALQAAGLVFLREHNILQAGKVKYRLDFALLCRRGKLDIECDGRRFHSPPRQHAKDTARDNWLKRRGWTTLRFGEHEIFNNVEVCIGEINTAIAFCGGLKARPPAPGPGRSCPGG